MGQPDVGATGIMGIAEEAIPGTYVAPTKFFPIKNESLKYEQATTWRRPIRGVNDVIGSIPGHAQVVGDVTMEAFEDVVPYFLRASRNTVVQTGTTPNFVYTSTPAHGSLPPGKTLSITVVRGGIVFGYTGCVVSQQSYTIDNDLFDVKYSIVGLNEAVQSAPTASFGSTIQANPYGAGMYDIEIPSGTPVSDVIKGTFDINDAAKNEWRARGQNTPAFTAFGERVVKVNFSRDFITRTEYDNVFKTLQTQALLVKATKGAANYIQLKFPASQINTDVISGLTGQGTLLHAEFDYQPIYDSATGKSYEIVCACQDAAA